MYKGRRVTRESGFTLIEVMITLAIMVLVATVGLANFRQSDNRAANVYAAQQLVGDLRLVASKALNADTFQKQNPGGWGISFNGNDSYIIFADLDGDKRYSAAEIDYKEKFKDVRPNANTLFDSSADIYFDSNAHPYNDGVAVTAVTGDTVINVTNDKGTAIATIYVNPLGAISLQN